MSLADFFEFKKTGLVWKKLKIKIDFKISFQEK
jgi:hypothetical protein